MGLDWNPIGKPKAGCEAEFERLFHELEGRSLPEKRSLAARLFSGGELTEAEKAERTARFQEIGEPPYATLGAPRVGYDTEADDWLRKKLEEDGRSSDYEEVRVEMNGYYALDLVPDCDGFPRYSNCGSYDGLDRYSFRGQFLQLVEDEIGEDLLVAAYENKLAPELVDYGKALLAKGEQFAKDHGLEGKPTFEDNDFDEESPETKADVILSAARWCIFWGERGHGLEVWY